MQTFTTKKKDIEFAIDEDVFKLKSPIPAGIVFEMSEFQKRIQEASQEGGVNEVLLESFQKLLDDESFQVFHARLYGAGEPIDMETFIDVTKWILGEVAGKGQTRKE